MNMGFELDREKREETGRAVLPVIKVMGVGGAGNNAINRMIELGIHGVDFIAVNTDVQVLEANKAPIKVQIGEKITRGLGAGGNPEVGKKAAEESIDRIKEILKDTDMLFIAAGFGGGTGTGAAPVIAEAAKEMGILTVAIVTTPFFFEGPKRWATAIEGLKEIKDKVDTLIRISNNKLLEEPDVEISKAFLMADEILHQGVKGISELITRRGVINLDFADIESIMRNAGAALLGIGVGKGEDRATEAVRNAMESKLVDYPIEDARTMIVNLTAPPNAKMKELNTAMMLIKQHTSDDTDIILGLMYDKDLSEDEIRITLIATRFEEDERILIPEEEVPAIYWFGIDVKKMGE
jgi:cell division protein FtsZ